MQQNTIQEQVENVKNEALDHNKMQNSSEKIIDIIFKEDDVTWQSIIYDLVKTEQMDPWDVDVTLITKKYLETIKQLNHLDFRISGKIVLASAILVKIKSNRFFNEDMSILDQIIASTQEDDYLSDDMYEEFEGALESELAKELVEHKPKVFPKTPQPRKRSVSVYELVEALEKALNVKARRKFTITGQKINVEIPEVKREITAIMQDIYEEITKFFENKIKDNMTFRHLLPSENKEDKVMTFIPLLHLENQRKINLRQEGHFTEIYIELLKGQATPQID